MPASKTEQRAEGSEKKEGKPQLFGNPLYPITKAFFKKMKEAPHVQCEFHDEGGYRKEKNSEI